MGDADGDVETLLAESDDAELERERDARRKRQRSILAKHGEPPGSNDSNWSSKPAAADYGEEAEREDAEAKLAHKARIAQNQHLPSREPSNGKSTYNTPATSGALAGEEHTDMFAETPTGNDAAAKRAASSATANGLQDNWDDTEGYYRAQGGEVISKEGRAYEVTDSLPLGRGVFSTVMRAIRVDSGRPVALKIIRNNETMARAAQLEMTVLRKIAETDTEDKKHCIRMLDTFEHREHTIMVFEAMDMNLRQVLRKYGRNVGIHTEGVQVYAKQMALALKHLRNNGVLHADIKPDNMLVNEQRTVLKICDFGSAMFDGNNEVTPYLVSRFYRAPEITLGLKYSVPIDLWSVGCCLYELATGEILFKGRTNNEMLKLVMDAKGSFPKKMLKHGLFVGEHFSEDGRFQYVQEDPATKQPLRRQMKITGASTDMPKLLGARRSGLTKEPKERLFRLADLLEKAFVLDPEKRITPNEVGAKIKERKSTCS
jgi:serine/threonine-protein kinase PRP4